MSFTVYRRPCMNHPKSNVKLPTGMYQCLRCVVPDEAKPDPEVRRPRVETEAERAARQQEMYNRAAELMQQARGRNLGNVWANVMGQPVPPQAPPQPEYDDWNERARQTEGEDFPPDR